MFSGKLVYCAQHMSTKVRRVSHGKLLTITDAFIVINTTNSASLS